MDVYLLSGRPIYFPFLPGILEYDCGSCDARCCRGGGLGIGRSKELAGLLHLAPALALFATEGFPKRPLPVLETVLEQCWFLDREDRCRLERAVGRAHKPAGCRLFPFNQLRGAGEWVVVMPHFQCPLRVRDAPALTGPTSHDELALEMHRVGVPRDGHQDIPSPPGVGWDKLMPVERRLRDAGRTHLNATDYAAYSDHQADLTAMALHTPRGPPCAVLRSRIATRLGYGDGKPSAARVRELVALTPYLRLRAASVPPDALPGMLTALSVLVAALENMPGAVCTARSVVQVFEKRALLLAVLARLLDFPRLKDGYEVDHLVRGDPLAAGPLEELLHAISGNERSSQPATLEEMLSEQRAFRPPLQPDAVGALVRLGRYIGEAVEFHPAE